MATFPSPVYRTPKFNSSSRSGIDSTLGTLSGNLTGQANATAGQRASEYNSVLPGYKSMLDSGYSDAEKSAISQGTTGAINQSYGQAADAAGRRMARTGNSAGYGSFLGENARSRGRDVATQEGQNQVAFAQEKQRRKLAGLEGISSLYGIDSSFLNSLNSNQNTLAGLSTGTYSTVKGHPGFLDTLTGTLASGIGNLLTLH